MDTTEYSSKNDTFQANNADKGGAIVLFKASLIENASSFEENTADLGAAIYTMKEEGVGSEMSMINGTFSKNVAATNGGAIYANGASVNVNGTVFTENTANSQSYGGGVFYISNTTITAENATFTNNTAVTHGGVVSMYTNSVVTFKDSIDRKSVV